MFFWFVFVLVFGWSLYNFLLSFFWRIFLSLGKIKNKIYIYGVRCLCLDVVLSIVKICRWFLFLTIIVKFNMRRFDVRNLSYGCFSLRVMRMGLEEVVFLFMTRWFIIYFMGIDFRFFFFCGVFISKYGVMKFEFF